MKYRVKAALTILLSAAILLPTSSYANTPQSTQEDEEDVSDIIVTSAMRVRQGGAQDIKHFRDTAATATTLPRPESLTIEGLFGEHDLALLGTGKCAQLFCLVSEAMPAALPMRPRDLMFVGLGFDSNITNADWARGPLNLVAVVDKSGSMSGAPLELVRQSLRQIVGQMQETDRISIVLYGDRSHVYLAPTTIKGNRDAVLAAISAIESAGSTNMEEGLRVGYDTAFADAPAFKGNTRMMLFTDEQPNVGRTDAGSFMGMATEASHRGIGLTTIGVGVQFNGALATKVSSARGGNLFFIANQEDVKTTFEKQLDMMVSEVAHDLKMTLTPAKGYKVSGVFGVPADIMTEAPDGAVSITVGSAFLSANGGGIFVSLASEGSREFLPAAALASGESLLNVDLGYVAAKTGKARWDRLSVRYSDAKGSAPLRTAQLLVDEYLSARDALSAFHIKGDAKAAHQLLSGLSQRMDGAGLSGMDGEKKLVGDMLSRAALYAGYAGEAPKSLRPLATVGMWEIKSVDGFVDLHRGDRLEFTSDRTMNTYRKSEGIEDVDESEDYEINERQVHLVDSKLVMSYRAKGDQMQLYTTDDGVRGTILLKRIASAE